MSSEEKEKEENIQQQYNWSYVFRIENVEIHSQKKRLISRDLSIRDKIIKQFIHISCNDLIYGGVCSIHHGFYINHTRILNFNKYYGLNTVTFIDGELYYKHLCSPEINKLYSRIYECLLGLLFVMKFDGDNSLLHRIKTFII